jgi:hypothetical protein
MSYERKARVTKREIATAAESMMQQRNELHLLLCAIVSRAGGEVEISAAAIRGLADGRTYLHMDRGEDGAVIVRVERKAQEMAS